MQLSCIDPLLKDFNMNTEHEPAVQDNVIVVPFKLINEICTAHKAGGSPDVLAVATGCEEWVIDTIVRFRKRRERFQKYCCLSKDPA